MKKIKKIVAIVLAGAMILGMTLTASAASCSWVRLASQSTDHCTSYGPVDKCTNHGELRCGLCGAIVYRP